jgi:hypothetical protein
VPCVVEFGRRGDLPSHALVQHGAPDEIDVSTARGGHEPRARVVRHAARGPLLERRDERVLREILGLREVAGATGERGDQAR